ncbi:exodeoxyribonuclease V subunit beta [Luteimonas aestuarii]|uniref:RecBCD enzyme subunit RecB n=1 Tax=Luteimonas aestuarii TaxID=453837 RepID=A0A4R5TSC6_9GAMM|nr:exodeoxyribonuclease V subunit beta [Luteimonas aestuarii]TDK23762.1 exodeoxyribonuclease V subunit beta [Luteimonas aestuarii]
MSAAELHEDDYLRLPLDGVQLIEASAGTGKTFTLATLFTRLVVERRLRIGQILAVTFTEAATQELRRRIRERLALAARLVDTVADDGDGDDHEAALTRAILARALQAGEETPAQLTRRLRVAAEEIDLASIFTIHGFCARVLSEHAIDSGHALDTPGLLANLQPLHAEVAADLWRTHANNADALDALTTLWNGPDALASDLRVLLGDLPLLPAPEEAMAVDDPRDGFAAQVARLSAAVDAHAEDAQAAIGHAFDAKVFDGRRARRASFDKAFDELRAGGTVGHWPRTDKTHLQKLLPAHLQAYCKEGRQDDLPTSPLFDALQAWCDADDAMEQWRTAQRIALLHHIRAEARSRVALLKRQRRLSTYDDLIDGVADALEGPRRMPLVEQLRRQYRVALVDEFQDTDARQWAIFHRAFGDSDEVRNIGATPALFVIGDPKQAIYGFRGGDVHTYLQAKAQARVAPPLRHNFRSRPAVLRAIDALYASAGDAAFLEHGIAFEQVLPGGKRSDGDYLRDGTPAPALTLRLLESDGGKPLNAEPSREAATAACVADIHRVLSDARAGRALIAGKPVQAGDIAVLVRTHREATRVQLALAAAGIPAVAAGKASLYATPEAQELRLLLLALLQPADEGRLRAALATVLLGLDAAAIAALDQQGDALRTAQDALLQWRERWQRGGPFALLSDLCAAQAERLLSLFDGERRITNYLQLGEALQEAATQSLGLHGLLDWLQARMVRADENDETQLLRLESDARRVQIVTLHKSKGLEYPLVYLPFAGIGGKPPATARHHAVHDGSGRTLHWKIAKDADWVAAEQRAAIERAAEDARLLYVGLTRAEHALWIAAGALKDFGTTRLAPLLADLPALRAGDDVRIVEGPAEGPPARLPPERDAAMPDARIATRHIAPDWWVYSFTQLARADGLHATAAVETEDSGAASDEPAQPLDDVPETTTDAATDAAADAPSDVHDPRFSGSRFGNVLHAALENTAFAAWANWQPGDDAPADEGEVLLQALREEGYAEADLDDGLATLTSLVGRTLTVPLPEGGALHAVPEHERRAEIEFHFAMQPTSVPELLELLHAHGVVRERRGFGLRRRLEGLMTGKIDLTYGQGGRWYVLDYKSNRLPRYDAPALAAAMAHSEYDLQSLVYTVALHRWLGFRLGDDYDYARDFGGIRYLFCRGLDAQDAASPGVFAHTWPPQLVHALDALFSGHTQGAAA